MAFKSKEVAVGTSDTDIFIMPATIEGAVVLGIGNQNAAARTVTLKFYNANDNTTTTFVAGYSIAANAVVKWPFPVLMSAGDKIIMSASNAGSVVAHASVTDSTAAPVATGFNPRGDWSSGVTYNANDLVRVENAISAGRGATYVAKANASANLNQNPTSATAFWMLYVADGPEGDLSASDIGVTVQPYDVDTLKADTTDDLTAGFTSTSKDQGTKSSGTFTPSYATGNVQHYVNGGAHTLAPPTGHSSMVIDVTNNGSAGAVTTSGFTKVDGDVLTTTNGHKFRFFITTGNAGSHLFRKAMQ